MLAKRAARKTVRPLNWDLQRLVREHRGGSFSTRRARSHVLAQAADTLTDLGFRGLRATGLRSKHVEALVAEWRRQGLAAGTVKNRMAHLRWWAERVGKPGVVKADNAAYGIADRRYVTNEDRSRVLDAERLALVGDEHVRMSLRLQAEFGLRREEAIKFQPRYADRGRRIVLKASWTKGGRAREIPVRNRAQREALDAARRLAKGGSLIPPGRSYVRQMKTYERQTAAAGLDAPHGLRHGYAQRRYAELTGRRCPAAGGPRVRDLDREERAADRRARLAIARELGHGRPEILATYCGS